MAKYIRQPEMALPNAGTQIIHHHIRTITNTNHNLLDVAVTAFFATLVLLASTPIVQGVRYQTSVLKSDPNPVVEYSVMIHYILVE